MPGLVGSLCPCSLYGRIAQRLEDPALKQGSCVNGNVSLPFHDVPYLASQVKLGLVLSLRPRQLLRSLVGTDDVTTEAAPRRVRNKGIYM